MTEITTERQTGIQSDPSPEQNEQCCESCVGNEQDEKWLMEQQQMLLNESRGIKSFHTIDSEVLFEKQLEK